MVLPDSLFEWFYDVGFPLNVRLNNISGGTDIAGSFGTGNALLPVYVGGCAGLALGIPVEVYDPSIDRGGAKGVAVADGTPGELVATAAFPNMPVGFWGQDGDRRYHQAYFAEFDRMLESSCKRETSRNLEISWLIKSMSSIRRLDAWGLCLHPPHHETAVFPRTRRWGTQSVRRPIRLIRDLPGH